MKPAVKNSFFKWGLSTDCGQFFISNFVSGIYEEYCCLTFCFQSAKKLVRHGFPKEDIFLYLKLTFGRKKGEENLFF
jgi:hypothetical protein